MTGFSPHSGSDETAPDSTNGLVAAIEQIGNRPLYIGDERAAGADGVKHELTETFASDGAIILSVCLRECPLTTHHYPLLDGRGNDPVDFNAAIDAGRDLYATVLTDNGESSVKGPMLINCAAGVSRSTTTLATVLAAHEGITFEAAVQEVKVHRSEARPHPALVALAERYLLDIDGVPQSHENAGIDLMEREYRYEWEPERR